MTGAPQTSTSSDGFYKQAELLTDVSSERNTVGSPESSAKSSTKKRSAAKNSAKKHLPSITEECDELDHAISQDISQVNATTAL